MNWFLSKVVRRVFLLLLRINFKIPALLEVEIQNIQGKGSGASSCDVEAKMAIDFLSRSGIKNPVVLDIGANIGKYSEAILKFSPQATIFAFEPSTFALKQLDKRFTGNDSVKIVPFALGSATSTETLWSDMAGSGLASLTKRKLEHFGIEFNHSESVEVTTLDFWANTTNVLPDLIKIDVEGHELDVLNGGFQTLALAQVVQFEFGGCNIDTRTFFQDFWYLFTGAGFAVYRISEAGPIRIPRYSEVDECFRTTNYLAVRE